MKWAARTRKYALAPAAEVVARTGLTIDELCVLAWRGGYSVEEFDSIDPAGQRTAMLRLPAEFAPGPSDGAKAPG